MRDPLLPLIPNYKLQESDDASQTVKHGPFSEKLKSLFLNLFDKKQQKLVGSKSLNDPVNDHLPVTMSESGSLIRKSF